MPDQSRSSDRQVSSIRWGILGTGTIARQFTTELVKLPDAQLMGVASRDSDKANAFAQAFRNTAQPVAYPSYADLCAAPEIDVVYIATPTASHAELARVALEAGKAVLCEKPFCRNAEEAAEVFELARAKGLFVMEAMWMRFNPLIQKTKRLLDEGTIGDVRATQVALGYAKQAAASGRAEDGRGARLAFGCYGVSLALYLFGTPQASSLHVVQGSGGTEDTISITLQYTSHLVSIQASEGATLTNDVRLQGTRGEIRITPPFIDTTALHVVSLDQMAQRSVLDRVKSRLGLASRDDSDESLRGSGFRGEAEEVMRCLRAGLSESPLMPWPETLQVHQLLRSSREAATYQTQQ